MEETISVVAKDPMRDSLMSDSDCGDDFEDDDNDDFEKTLSVDIDRQGRKCLVHAADIEGPLNLNGDGDSVGPLNPESRLGPLNPAGGLGHLNGGGGPLIGEGASGANSLDLDFDLWEGQIDFSATNPFYDSVFVTEEFHRAPRLKEMVRTVHMLQHQVGALAENQVNHDDRVSRVKQDNSALQARVMMLEEQLRETEIRGDNRLAEEQRRNKELICRVEREKILTIENFSIRQMSLEKDKTAIVDDNVRLKGQVAKLARDNELLEDKLSDLEYASSSLTKENCEMGRVSKREREELRIERERSSQVIEELRAEVERLRAVEEAYTKRSSVVDASVQLPAEMHAEVKQLRSDNRHLLEQIEELQAQLLTSTLEEGRTLVSAANNNSLAAEFEQMTSDEDAHDGCDMDQLRKSLKESQEANDHLRTYIDGILLNIVDNYPQLLEVKATTKR